MHDLEITVPLVMTASMTFHVNKDEWEGMSEKDRRVRMAEEANLLQAHLDNAGGFQGNSATLYGNINECLLDSAEIYDKEIAP